MSNIRIHSVVNDKIELHKTDVIYRDVLISYTQLSLDIIVIIHDYTDEIIFSKFVNKYGYIVVTDYFGYNIDYIQEITLMNYDCNIITCSRVYYLTTIDIGKYLLKCINLEFNMRYDFLCEVYENNDSRIIKRHNEILDEYLLKLKPEAVTCDKLYIASFFSYYMKQHHNENNYIHCGYKNDSTFEHNILTNTYIHKQYSSNKLGYRYNSQYTYYHVHDHNKLYESIIVLKLIYDYFIK